ncbi:MAG: acyl--CoA ligase [Nitrospira sp.]|nr:MAG: acyl--CoA ligase [Nitrospira sp.]
MAGMDLADHIAQAQHMDGPRFSLPWRSFEEFFTARVNDPALAERPFLVYLDDERRVRRTYSYSQFGWTVSQLALVLRQQGLRRGGRLATMCFNHDQAVLLYFAAWTIGVAVVPINVEESEQKKRYILEHSEATVICCWADCLEEVRAIQKQVPGLRRVIPIGDDGLLASVPLDPSSMGDASEPEEVSLSDEALIVYTSGTTGEPKGVVLTAENLLIDADGIADWHGFTSDDRLMCVLPIHHVNGAVVTLVTPFYFGGGVVLTRKFKAGTFWRHIHAEGVTCVSVVPTVLEFLLMMKEDARHDDLSRFRGVICGAGPLLKDTAFRFTERFGVPIHHGYGLSETTCYSCFLPRDLSADERRRWLIEYEFPSIGSPIRHNEMAILDERGRPLPEHRRGEICIRGRTVCRGYFKRPDANEAAFRGGWFRSGDEGFYVRDKEGRPFFFISGRIKELIIRGGINISPLEIDEVLRGHPEITFAMAVPFEHRLYGEEIAAYLVPKNATAPPKEADLLAYCRGRLPFAKRPKVFLFGEDIPYTSTGKPKRIELAKRLAPELAAYREVRFVDRG